MTIVAALLVPGSPLPYIQRDNPPWRDMARAMEAAATALAESQPETIAIYSTQWMAVLDQLWQTRPHVFGIHVDENWHEYGDLPYDFRTDTELVDATIAATADYGIRSKGVDYDHFPVDTGTIVASNFLDPNRDFTTLSTANNLYHDWALTENLGRVVREQAEKLNRRIALIGVGGFSGNFFRHTIDVADDHIAKPEDDAWNRRILELMEQGDSTGLLESCPDYVAEAKADMGFKHCAYVLGGLAHSFSGAKIHHYGPLYGTGGAVVEFLL